MQYTTHIYKEGYIISPIGVKAMPAFSSKIKKNIYISDNSAQQ
jgi:hypothetical protein